MEEELIRIGRDMQWLSEQTGLALVVLRRRIEGEADFSVADLGAIAAALDISVARLTPDPH